MATVPNTALIFNADNWESPKTVTVTTVNNDIDEDTDRSTTITHAFVGGGYNSVSGSVTVTATDNDMRGATFDNKVGTNNNGLPNINILESETKIYGIKLTSKPTGNVDVSFSSSNVGVLTVPSTAFTFTSADWDGFKNVLITPINDDVASGITIHTITHTFVGGDYNSVTAPLSVTLVDLDSRRYPFCEHTFLFGRGGGFVL